METLEDIAREIENLAKNGKALRGYKLQRLASRILAAAWRFKVALTTSSRECVPVRSERRSMRVAPGAH